GFTAAKPTVAHFPPLLMLAFAYGVTGLCLARNLARIETPFWRLFLVSALVTTVQGGLVFSGLSQLPASTAVLVRPVGGPFPLVLPWPLAGRRRPPVRLCGIALAFAGVAIVAGAPRAAGSWIPVLFVGGGTAVWALGQAAARRLSRDHGAVFLAGISVAAVPQALAAPARPARGQWTARRTATPMDWVGLATVILAAYLAAYTIWYGLLRRYRVDQVTPFAFLMPLFGLLASAVLLGETMSLGELAGGAVVMAGLAVVVLAR